MSAPAAKAPVKAAAKPAVPVKGTAPAKSATKATTAAAPAKKTIQKFGMQVQKSKNIYVFRNGDKHHKGEKVTIRAGKTFEQVGN